LDLRGWRVVHTMFYMTDGKPAQPKMTNVIIQTNIMGG
jgi:hypothetical protein